MLGRHQLFHSLSASNWLGIPFYCFSDPHPKKRCSRLRRTGTRRCHYYVVLQGIHNLCCWLSALNRRYELKSRLYSKYHIYRIITTWCSKLTYQLCIVLNQKSVVVAIEMNILEEHLLAHLSDIIDVKVEIGKYSLFLLIIVPHSQRNTISNENIWMHNVV